MSRQYQCGRCKAQHHARYWYADIRYARRCGKCTREMENEIKQLRSANAVLRVRLADMRREEAPAR